jgi:hypothetical protein
MKNRDGHCAVLMIALVVMVQPAAWSQGGPGSCAVIGGNGTDSRSCLHEGTQCGVGTLLGSCKTGARSDSPYICNCVDESGGLVPKGEPGPLVTVAVAGPFLATGEVTIKELNTGTTSVTNLHPFVVHPDGTFQFATVSKLAPGQTQEQTFSITSSTSVPVLVGMYGATKAVRLDAASLNPDGTGFNMDNREWELRAKTPYYSQQNVIDLSGDPSTPLLGPWQDNSTAPFQLFVYNNQFSDEAYTLNVVNDSGTTTSSMPLTVPAGQIGTVSLSPLSDFHVTIVGPGIAGADLANQALVASPAAGSKAPH